jgi:hypothetical protein
VAQKLLGVPTIGGGSVRARGGGGGSHRSQIRPETNYFAETRFCQNEMTKSRFFAKMFFICYGKKEKKLSRYMYTEIVCCMKLKFLA